MVIAVMSLSVEARSSLENNSVPTKKGIKEFKRSTHVSRHKRTERGLYIWECIGYCWQLSITMILARCGKVNSNNWLPVLNYAHSQVPSLFLLHGVADLMGDWTTQNLLMSPRVLKFPHNFVKKSFRIFILAYEYNDRIKYLWWSWCTKIINGWSETTLSHE